MTKPVSRLTSPFRSASVAAIRPSRSVSRVLSKFSCTDARKMLERATPPTTNPTTVQIVAAAMRRAERELSLCPIFGTRIFKAIAKSTHRLNEICVQLSSQPAHEHFDGIRVAIEILIIQMLDQLGTGDDPPLVVGKIGEQPILERRQFDGIAIERHAIRARVNAQGSDFYICRSDACCSPQERPHSCQQFLGIKWLSEIVVGSGVESGHLVAPTVARRQDKHRHRSTSLAPLLKNAHAIQLRQP